MNTTTTVLAVIPLMSAVISGAVCYRLGSQHGFKNGFEKGSLAHMDQWGKYYVSTIEKLLEEIRRLQEELSRRQ